MRTSKSPLIFAAAMLALFAFALLASMPSAPTAVVLAQVSTSTFTPSATLVVSSTPLTPTTIPVTIPPALTPSLTPSACLVPRDFKVGDIVVLIPGISIRVQPNPNSALLANFQDRREFTIIGGPSCFGGFNFWAIEGHGISGWVAEGRGTQYWLSLVRRGGTPVTPCLAPLDLTVGEDFEIVLNVRIRETPSLLALTRTVVPAESSVIILEGPTCADGYNWWRVRAVVVGVTYEGWMAEASRFGEAYVDVPYQGSSDGTICAYPLNLQAGERVRVIYNDGIPKNLRAAPDLQSAILYELVAGVPMVIVGGPVCADTYNWWQVRILSSTEVTGWFAEGGPEAWWIARNRLP